MFVVVCNLQTTFIGVKFRTRLWNIPDLLSSGIAESGGCSHATKTTQPYGIPGDLDQAYDKKVRFMELLECCLTQRKEAATIFIALVIHYRSSF